MDFDKIVALARQHPDWGRIRLRNASHGAPRRMVDRALVEARSTGAASAGGPPTRPKKAAGRTMSLNDLMRRYDPDTKAAEAVARAVKTIRPGRLISDYDLRKQVGFSDQLAWTNAAEARDEYNAMRIRTPDRKIYWADAATAKRAIEECAGTEYAFNDNFTGKDADR